MPIDDYFVVSMGFKKGIAITEDNRATYFNKFLMSGDFQVIGTKGMISYDGENAGMRIWNAKGTMIPFATMYQPNENGLFIQTMSFIKALAHGDKMPIDFRNTAKVYCVIEAAIQSYNTKRNEKINYDI